MKTTYLALSLIAASVWVILGAEIKGENSIVKNSDDAQISRRENARPAENLETQNKAACLNLKLPGKKLIASQTFPIDFEPFKKACFVTFADRKEMLSDDDLPRGSTFYMFRDGKQVFEFPDAFNNLPGCWATSVAFQDLNNDSLTDIVIAGKCLAAKDSFPQNMVYANTGDAFATRNDANEKLSDFEKTKDIADFAKRNQKLFF